MYKSQEKLHSRFLFEPTAKKERLFFSKYQTFSGFCGSCAVHNDVAAYDERTVLLVIGLNSMAYGLQTVTHLPFMAEASCHQQQQTQLFRGRDSIRLCDFLSTSMLLLSKVFVWSDL